MRMAAIADDDSDAKFQLHIFPMRERSKRRTISTCAGPRKPWGCLRKLMAFSGMSCGLTICIYLLHCMLAASLHISMNFSKIQWFYSLCFRRRLSDATAAKYYHIVPWLNDLMWHMGGCSVQSWMYHACPCVCKLRPCNCLPKGNENNQTSPAVE